MKPRRENGATLVSPMTSDVCMGSALMMDFLWHVWWLRNSPDPCSKPARESFGSSVRTKATLESSISRLLLNPNLAKEGGAARRGIREPHSAGNRCGTQITSLRGCGWDRNKSEEGAGYPACKKQFCRQEKNKAVSAVYRKRPCQPRTLKSACAAR